MGESLKERVFAGNRQRKTFIREGIFLYNNSQAARHRESGAFLRLRALEDTYGKRKAL